MADKFQDEVMSDAELDNVSGGNYVELLKDMKYFAALGLIDPADVPKTVNYSNFNEVNRTVYEIWQQFGINMSGREADKNSYTLPAKGQAFGNTRRGALNYAKYRSERGDITVDNFI